jgi:ligand-binding sensor domain-containing protein
MHSSLEMLTSRLFYTYLTTFYLSVYTILHCFKNVEKCLSYLSENKKIMKAFIIGALVAFCLYSAETLAVKKQEMIIPKTDHWDDTVVYGPQLPCYYSRAVSEYIRRTFQDSKGNLWFGTNTDGLATYDGKALSYLTIKEGLSGSQVTGIMEDKNGNLWFSTNEGITRYNPSKNENTITRFSIEDGLSHASTWSIFQDSKGTIWAGTFSGLCRFNGTRFEDYLLPNAAKSWIRSITEDQKGNLWVATSDKGAFKISAGKVEQISQKDGLCSNDLTCILEDSKGNIWFGSMDGGVSKFNGSDFTNFTAEKEIGSNEVWTIYEDKSGNIWFTSEGYGVYRYKNGLLTHFGEKEGFSIKAVQTIYEDRSERLWFGGGDNGNGKSLLLYFGGAFTPVTREGPWNEGC